jgi:hypothetical protein
MKKVMFSLLVVFLASSFAMPPVIQNDKKNDWVYELVKPAFTYPHSVVYIRKHLPYNGQVDYSVTYQNHPVDRKLYITLYYVRPLYPMTITTYTVNIPANTIGWGDPIPGCSVPQMGYIDYYETYLTDY